MYFGPKVDPQGVIFGRKLAEATQKAPESLKIQPEFIEQTQQMYREAEKSSPPKILKKLEKPTKLRKIRQQAKKN